MKQRLFTLMLFIGLWAALISNYILHQRIRDGFPYKTNEVMLYILKTEDGEPYRAMYQQADSTWIELERFEWDLKGLQPK